MAKKIWRCLGICLIIMITVNALVGCIGHNTTWEPSWTDKYEHEKRHLRAFWQDMADIHRFIDRYLFNFDEDDPARY